MKKALFITVALLIAACYGSMRSCMQERAKRIDAEKDRSALLQDVDLYRTKAEHSAAGVQVLRMERDELLRYRSKYEEVLRDLEIKTRRVRSLSETVGHLELELQAALTREPIRRDSSGIVIQDTLTRFHWSDPWTRVEGTLTADSIRCRIQATDTLTQVIHRIPRRFLFFRWGTKALRQEVVTSNPHNRIVYTEFIQVRK